MYEKQPILMALIKAGFVGAPCLKGFQINEKNETGTALIQLKHESKPSKIFWDKDKDAWVEKRPAYYMNPNIIAKHYASVI